MISLTCVLHLVLLCEVWMFWVGSELTIGVNVSVNVYCLCPWLMDCQFYKSYCCDTDSEPVKVHGCVFFFFPSRSTHFFPSFQSTLPHSSLNPPQSHLLSSVLRRRELKTSLSAQLCILLLLLLLPLMLLCFSSSFPPVSVAPHRHHPPHILPVNHIRRR